LTTTVEIIVGGWVVYFFRQCTFCTMNGTIHIFT